MSQDFAIDADTVSGEQQDVPGAPRFDQRHLIRLYQLKLLKKLPYELGPMPDFEFGPVIDTDLRRWNVIEGNPPVFTEPAAELFAGVDSWQWALWGLVLLYNERVRTDIGASKELESYHVKDAVRTIPRVTFMITVRESTVTLVLLNQAQMQISAFPDTFDIVDTVAILLKSILDPDEKWKPYPMDAPVMVALDTLADAADTRIDPDGPDRLEKEDLKAETADEKEYSERLDEIKEESGKELAAQRRDTIDKLIESGVSSDVATRLADLLKVHNTAAAQVCVTWQGATRKVTLENAAAGVLFFDGDDEDHRGTVVSYPTKTYDGSLWATYTPGTEEAYTDAVRNLRDLAKSAAQDH